MPAAICYKNNLDTSLTPLISVSSITASYDVSFPAANMLDDSPSKVTRVNVGAGSGSFATYVLWNGTTNNKQARVIYLANVRLPAAGATISVGARALNFNSTTAASATFAITNAQALLIPGTTDRYNLAFILSASTASGGVAIDFSCSAWLADYVEIGHIRCGDALVLEPDREWSLMPIDPSASARGRGGDLAAQRLPTRVAMRLSFLNQTYANMVANSAAPSGASMREFALYSGVGLPIVVLGRTLNVTDIQANGIYGALTQLPEPSHVSGNYLNAEFVVEQIR